MRSGDAGRSLRPGATKVGRDGFYGNSIRRAAGERNYRGIHKVRDGGGLSGFGYVLMAMTVLGVIAATGLVLWAATLPPAQASGESALGAPSLSPLVGPTGEQGSPGPSVTAPVTPTPTRSRSTTSPEAIRPTSDPGATTPRPAESRGAPPTSPTAQPFPQIVIQAEDPRNELLGAQVVRCGTCDGGYRVRYIGDGNHLVMHAQVPVAGPRTMGVVYESDGPRTLMVSVNGGPPQVRQVTGGSWETPALVTFQIVLPSGSVDIRFYSDAGPGADVDKVIIQ
ncbi:hypothetical protein BDK92_1918 [Micromonospora pisi]|uniref:CBM6 domain-containing protein n=1 Tax=Micromonospora pisi TaxID=589240 RepID=A0A495JFE7_9ACTN|nr:hypothetical protein [Micromonospora pisi]RKR87627.1 hypothetical protein BDK92_1918 [Micromonospora pisi]